MVVIIFGHTEGVGDRIFGHTEELDVLKLLSLTEHTEVGLRKGLNSSSSDANKTGNCVDGRRDSILARFLETRKNSYYFCEIQFKV